MKTPKFIEDNKKLFFSIMEFGFWAWIIIAAIVLFVCSIFAIVGWALITIVSIFTVVSISGFFSYAGIGLAACIVGAVISR